MKESTFPYRIGFGYDIHQLCPHRKLILGGIEIPSDLGLLGHSDADVLLHAISDALLGAAALRDIGYHFPDTAPAYKDADSTVLLANVVQLLHAKGYAVGNIDATIVAEAPKLNPHIPQMVSRISEILQVSPNAVSIKATTHEKLDATGRREGICAFCNALIYSTTP